MFITVTLEVNENKVYLNIAHIIAIEDTKDGVRITLSTGATVRVKEEYSTVRSNIQLIQ